MALIIIFQKNPELLSLSEMSHSMAELLGLGMSVIKGSEVIAIAGYADAGKEFVEGMLTVDLPELEEDEGEPLVNYLAAARLDREAEFEEFIGEIVQQDPSLKEVFTENTRDLYLICDDTPAGLDALSALAYVIASETESGILLRTQNEEDDTVWFPDAEQFADVAFGEDDNDDDDDDYEDGEEDDEEKD